MQLTISIETRPENAFMRDRNTSTTHIMGISDKLNPIHALQQIEFLVTRLSQDADNAAGQMTAQAAQSLADRHPKDPQEYHAYGQGT